MLGMANHPAPPLVISESERAELLALARAGKTEQRIATRARIALAAGEGRPNRAIASDLGVSPMTVLLWRGRFTADRVAGLRDAPRPGREPIYGRTERDRVIALTLEPPPQGVTHWSARRMSARTGISITTIQRIWAEANLKPHRVETFKWSTDPELEAKVRDVVGLYLNPPERAVVLSIDEKTQIQALDRTQPMLPMKPGQVERHTHDYKRNGTTSLFAALNVATGEVTQEARARHTGLDFLAFLRRIEHVYPDQELHVVLDNVSSHKTPDIAKWLRAHPRNRLSFHPDQRLVDEPDRDLVRHPHTPGLAPEQLPKREGIDRHDRRLHGPVERGLNALCLGQDRRPDPGQGRPEVSSVQRIGTLDRRDLPGRRPLGADRPLPGLPTAPYRSGVITSKPRWADRAVFTASVLP